MRPQLAIAVALALTGCNRATAAEVTVYRDGYGVPSIVANTLNDGMYGVGYAQAQDRAERIAMTYKLARGRMSEINGRGAMLQDGLIRGLGIEEYAEKYAASMPAEQRAMIQAYVDGANKALDGQKGKIPAWIEHFTLVDVLSLAQLANIAFPLQSLQNMLGAGVGSNQFAIDGKHTSTHHPILSLDPHVGIDGQNTISWHEFGFYADGINFRGIAIPGLPVGVAGHNDRVAWSETNNDPVLYNLFTVKTNPVNSKQYSYHGEWRNFETKAVELKYLDGGTLHSFKQSVKMTAWGPMVPLTSYAVRFTTVGDFAAVEEGIRMMRAKNVDDLRNALGLLGLSMWNIVAADVEGNILYQFNAHIPHRDSSIDWRRPVDGSLATTAWGDKLWTTDELPHAKNPASGLLINCNSAPWLTTLGDEISKIWPRDISTYGSTTRYARLAELLKDQRRISPERAMQIATDTQVPDAKPTADRFVLYGDGKLPEVHVMDKWNGRADADSVGTALYVAWLEQRPTNAALAREATAGNSWRADQTAQALKDLSAAAEKLKKSFGRVDVKWGQVLRLIRGDKQVPAGGFGYIAGVGAAVRPTTGAPQPDGTIRANFGSSTRMIVSLDPNGVKSWSVLPYGNSEVVTSPHWTDQMELYANGKYKPDAFGEAAVKAVAKETLRLNH